MNQKILPLNPSQSVGYDQLSDERAVIDARIARFRAACLVELGGLLSEPWQFDEIHHRFWINVPDNPLTHDNGNASRTHAGAETG